MNVKVNMRNQLVISIVILLGLSFSGIEFSKSAARLDAQTKSLKSEEQQLASEAEQLQLALGPRSETSKELVALPIEQTVRNFQLALRERGPAHLVVVSNISASLNPNPTEIKQKAKSMATDLKFLSISFKANYSELSELLTFLSELSRMGSLARLQLKGDLCEVTYDVIGL